ncbi:Multidrug resistance protein MdtB [Poriferisphaera corsica]|uniref:Multidrug resistance protein MdtB n=1 Tax=Poriferisphaera corsica TaxID=2528020 RepID=A0A517YU34_9BACT|nr:efflux RND transporter permease subunit [Poriferisphaera corsica]QDU33743.1 Multidrug resistance protein MdtB [Poriferisphaera corsica]
MKISDCAIEKPRLVILAAVIMCLVGLVAAISLPKERTPRVKLPVILVAIPNPGGSPATNESQIVRRIEEEVGTLSDLRDEGSVMSQAVNGAALVQFVFDDGVDVKEAKRDVESMINRIKGEFPEDAQTDPGPLVSDIAFEDWPIIQVFIAGGDSAKQRRRIADQLQRHIEEVSGISAVDIFGGLEDEIIINVDPNRMTLYGFSYGQIALAVSSSNIDSPTGDITIATGNDARVRAKTKIESLEAIETIPLGTRDGKPILLHDVAHVEFGNKDPDSIARYGGDDAVVLLARAKTDVNVLGAADRIQEIVDRFVADGKSENTTVGTVRSQAREIRYMISQLGMSAVYGTILVIIILWIMLGYRNAFLIGIAVPFAILASGAFMWLAKRTIMPDISINNMTLFALILVIGMVVDGCIIVGENIFRHRELGESPVDAAKRGINEVGPSLIGAYLTTFAAFGPMFVVRGVMGDFMSLLPTTVMFALLAAMLVDHFLLPVMSMYVMKVPKRKLQKSFSEMNPENLTPAQIEIRSANTFVQDSRIRQIYGNMIQYAIHHRFTVLILSILMSITPVILFRIGAIKFEFFPKADVPIVQVYFELPLGSSMEQKTTEVAASIESAILKAVHPDEWYLPSGASNRVKPVTTIGEPGALNINLDNDNSAGPEFGMVYVELELAENRDRSASEIRKAIADELPIIPGVKTRVSVPEEGPPTGSPVLIRLLGNSDTPLESLAEKAAEIEVFLRSLPGTYDVSNDYRMRPELVVEPNRATASLYDVNAAQIASAVNFAFEGVRVSDVDFGGDEEIDIRIRNNPNMRDEFRDLNNLPIRTETGRIVTLSQVADIDHQYNANVIRHYDQQRVINIRSHLDDDVIPDDIKKKLIEYLRTDLSLSEQRQLLNDRSTNIIQSSSALTIRFGGENKIRDDALEDLTIALIIAFGAMLIILTVKFNSFIQPLIILFSVPLSLVGVSIGLMICGFYFSISAMIGVVALSGIVVNDAIVLVDFINRLKKAGLSSEQACIRAGQLRIRPIFLTTVTTIGGLIPLALNISGGGEFWQPLTISIMFGLGFATLLQLFIIPLSYYTFISETNASLLDPLTNKTLSNPLNSDSS